MNIDAPRFQQLLSQFKLPQLFNELGWDQPALKAQTIHAGGAAFTLTPIAHKRGVAVLRCSPDASGKIPPRPVLLKIEHEARKLAHEHLLVFADADETMLTWLWVLRAPGQPASTRTHTWHKGQSGEALRQKLSQIVWSLEAEEAITLTDVITGLRRAFDRDRVSKSFYDKFKAQHDAFAAFITGLNQTADRAWYASLMLNRLMFVYFIQKKGFLDGDENYLQNRMSQVQQAAGKGQFHSFYRRFLRRLFHDAHVASTHLRRLMPAALLAPSETAIHRADELVYGTLKASSLARLPPLMSVGGRSVPIGLDPTRFAECAVAGAYQRLLWQLIGDTGPLRFAGLPTDGAGLAAARRALTVLRERTERPVAMQLGDDAVPSL